MLPLLPFSFARSHAVLLTQVDSGSGAGLLAQGCARTSLAALTEISREFGAYAYETMDEDAFNAALQNAYGASGQNTENAGVGSAQSIADAVGDNVAQDADLARLMDDMPALEDLLDSAADAPIIRLINALLTQAVRDGASDIHIEPFEDASVVRLRVDGTLRDIARPKRALHAALVSRIKIMASLDIAEKRLPQDGRMSLKIGGRPVDVRVSTLPVGGANSAGERAVLRLLDKSATKLDLAALGMTPTMLAQIDALIQQPHGIVLVTGPTGSGKTTTLYSALRRLDAATTNIMTVEDPIEYELPNIGQTQVNAKIDLTFAMALRAILRQDPDVVMIGEIRDLETAQIAVQASLTGHLVLATLHTNDSISAITRLADMGIEPYLLSSSLVGVVAQRLVRTLCTQCKVPENQTENPTETSSETTQPRWRAVGCPACKHSGYVGRSGAYECLSINDALRPLIHSHASEPTLRAAAMAQGFAPLFDDAMRYVNSGKTSLAEVLRVAKDAG